jgi:hypothetical protein
MVSMWIRPAGGLALVGVLGIGVLAVSYLSSVEPLAVGSSWATSGAERREPRYFEVEPAYEFRFVELGEVQWGVEVRNTLALPVTIRGLHPVLRDTNAFVVEKEIQLLSGSSVGFEPHLLRPFSSVELTPNETVFLMMSNRFLTCEWAEEHFDPGTGVGLEELRLDVTVLGVPKVAHIALPFQLAFKGPEPDDC